MSLRDEAIAGTRHSGTQVSTIQRLLNILEGDDRDEVVSLIWDRDPGISARAVAETLTRHFSDKVGVISRGQVEDHWKKPRP